ncbi:MAG: S-adenosylmethionine decarboxylase [Gemmataceae bacterium]|nr:S-adenosylmethionine decarboxylase [Gemmataceae bacterium]
MATNPSVFGRSLHADFYQVDRHRCDDIGFFYQFLDDLTAHLGMHQQAPPFVFRSPAADYPDKAGLSGWVPLIESGISVHTLTVTGFVSVDIYTCGAIDVPATLAFLRDRLGSDKFESHYLERGMEYGLQPTG